MKAARGKNLYFKVTYDKIRTVNSLFHQKKVAVHQVVVCRGLKLMRGIVGIFMHMDEHVLFLYSKLGIEKGEETK